MSIVRFIRRLRISECNDWRSFFDPAYPSGFRSFAPIMLTLSKIRMDRYIILGTFMIMGYGFQVRLHV